MVHAERLAVWAGLFAGLAFGIFWIPIRSVEAAGFEGPWAAAVFTGVPMIAGLVALIRHRSRLASASLAGLMAGVLGGLAFALYAAAFLHTDVVRALLLFYMTPIWGFLLGWAMLKDPVTPLRWFAIALGLSGMTVILGLQTGLPLPRNPGDWMALAGGVVWAFAAVLMLREQSVGAATHAAIFFLASGLFAIVFASLASAAELAPAPDWSGFGALMLWLVPLTLLLTLPAGYATVYAPTKLNPGVVGLLFMIEIGVGTVTAAMLTDEPLGSRELAGVILVMVAGLLEPARSCLRRQVRTPCQDNDPARH